MLSKELMGSAYPLAQVMARKGLALRVVGDSPLAELTALCAAPPIEVVDGEEHVVEADERLLETASAESFDGVAEHEEAMCELVASAAKAVDFAMDQARNVVLPKVKAVAEFALAAGDSRAASVEPLTIQPVFLNPIYSSPELADMIAPFAASMPNNVAPVRLTHSWSDMGSALRSGDGAVDSLAGQLYAGREDDVKSVWERFFAAVPGQYRDGDLSKELADNDHALAVFLGANQLMAHDEAPEGLDVSLGQYRTYLAQVREQAAAALGYRLKNANAAISAKTLVISAPVKASATDKVSGVIAVNGDVYNQWLAEGGTPEALLGAVLTGVAPHYDRLLPQVDQLASAWNIAVGALETKAKFARQAGLLDGLRTALIDVARELTDGGTIDNDIYGLIDERLRHFHVKDLDDVYGVARKAVCRIFFPHTDAEKILNAMDAVCASKPDMPKREAALLVMIDYVTEWVSQGISVTSTAVIPA